ncbi:MAG TPA: Gfo/Idh/MocA family oxidoreductase [Actinopolymorphaceae bacterium]|nr:Gfo/Idh/MocA family oxidoreductase [Actinopolymorphaceae bacterium]
MIGCGGASSWHTRELASMAGVEIVGLAEPNAANLERFKSRVPLVADVPSFADAEEMFASVELDAVSVVTPHTLHYPIVMSAIKRGLHVLCEKPLTCESAHARDIETAAEAAGVTVMVPYQRRFDPAYGYMKAAIDAGELGELRSITVTCGQHWMQGTAGSWRQDPALSGGGMLMDSGSHLVDMLLWLIGRPVASVSALVDNAGSPVDINAAATVRFDGGIHGQLTVIGDLATTWMETVVVSGTEGLLRYEIEPQHPWRTGRVVHCRNDEIVQPLRLAEGPDLHEVWLAAIRGETPNPSPPSAGLRVAELSEAIYSSAQLGQTVNLNGR